MSVNGTNLYTAQRLAQFRVDEAVRQAERTRAARLCRQPRNAPRAAIASVIAVLAVASIAACGTDTTSPTPPANAPVEARIYPPTNVPEVRLGPTSADAAERRMAQNEEKQHRAGGQPAMP